MKKAKGDPFILEHEIDDTHLDRRVHGLWTEDAFLDTRGKKIGQGNERREQFIGKSMSNKRIAVVATCFVFLFAFVFFRIFFLQMVKGEEYQYLAEQNRLRQKIVLAPRGTITDRFGKSLTENVPSFTLVVTPSDLPQKHEERRKVIETLARLLEEQKDLLLEEFNNLPGSGYDSVPLRQYLSYEKALLIKIEAARLGGISIETHPSRRYLFMEASEKNQSVQSLSHILGYVGKITSEEWKQRKEDGYLLLESVGKSGIESFYEQFLRGKHGRREVEVNALGKEQKTLVHEREEPGETIRLTIDLEMQQRLEQALRKVLTELKRDRGAALVMEPTTGAIRALVSSPTFNANDLVQGNREKVQTIFTNKDLPLFNRVISGLYPPGSTIKPVFAAEALLKGIITRETSFLSVGGLRVSRWFFPDWKEGGHGLTNVTKAIAESVNTFFYIIGGGWDTIPGLGLQGLTDAARRFGFGKALGIDLIGEQDGFLPSVAWKEEKRDEPWYIGDTYHLAIGQGDILVTPLQIATMMASFANGGMRVTPHFVEAIGKENRAIAQNTSEEKRIIPSEVVGIVRQGLRGTVLWGSAARLSALPITSAGKTGTAEGGREEPHGWFAGFAPYEKPELVITVLIEEGGEGSRSAARVAYDFLSWYAAYRSQKGGP